MIRIRQIKINVPSETTNSLMNKIMKKYHLSKEDIIDLSIVKKSIDARDKENVFFVYEVDLKVKNEEKLLKKYQDKDFFLSPVEKYNFEVTGEDAYQRPVIIGSGPAGLFCAYLLAENNYKPLIIERGEKVEDRVKSVEEFWQTSNLNPNSNIQFGEGGAGTFSDGKLNTLVKDKNFRGKRIFEIFVENGAPKEIMYENKPHIGTDILRKVIINMRNNIIKMGGEFKYNTTLTNIEVNSSKIEKIELNNKEIISCNLLILAIGHSARDTFEMLLTKKITMQPKSFAVGVRIEHPQDMINQSQYGKFAKYLPPASYKLTYTTKQKRGVYSFCMCPGGYVVNASSEANHLAINGMSNHKRESKNANSALVVTVTPNDFGPNPLDGVKYQRNLEKAAYQLANGKIPIQLLKDFKANTKSINHKSIEPITKGDYSYQNLNDFLPTYITDSLKEAITYFGTKIKGFDQDDSLLLAIESRTSSPVRIIRDETGQSNIKGIYPIGEGAGYAGGITSAAIDGLKTAELIAKKYKPYKEE